MIRQQQFNLFNIPNLQQQSSSVQRRDKWLGRARRKIIESKLPKEHIDTSVHYCRLNQFPRPGQLEHVALVERKYRQLDIRHDGARSENRTRMDGVDDQSRAVSATPRPPETTSAASEDQRRPYVVNEPSETASSSLAGVLGDLH